MCDIACGEEMEIGCRNDGDDGSDGGGNENIESIKEKRKYDDTVEALWALSLYRSTTGTTSEQQ